jgi:WhiB family redox-sensing transcriptional regulator
MSYRSAPEDHPSDLQTPVSLQAAEPDIRDPRPFCLSGRTTQRKDIKGPEGPPHHQTQQRADMTSTARRTHHHPGRAPHREAHDRHHRHPGEAGQQKEITREEVTRDMATLTLTELINLRTDAQAGGDVIPCREYDAELWFAESPADVEFAKSLCGTCPALEECLAGALQRREPWGVWGGQLFVQGVVVPRKRPRGRPRKNEIAA